MVWIRVATSPGTKVSPRPTGLTARENLSNRAHEEKQMTTTATLIGASSPCSGWEAIQWHPIRQHVLRLQMRIAKAIREGRRGKVESLQRLLTHSFNAKLLAVKRVTENSGRKTVI